MNDCGWINIGGIRDRTLVYWGFCFGPRVGNLFNKQYFWTKQPGNWEVAQKKWCPIPPARKRKSPIAVNTWGEWGVANNSGKYSSEMNQPTCNRHNMSEMHKTTRL